MTVLPHRWCACALMLITLLETLPVVAREAPPPNIILVLVDDLGRETIGALGGESYATPHIDQLAKDGLNFDICLFNAVTVIAPSTLTL